MAFTRLIVLFYAFAFFVISSMAHADGPVILPVHPERLEITTDDGQIITEFNIEIAATFDQRATGLMHRENFGGDDAMLFDFGLPREISMWMKNTPSSLDMLFAGRDGQILAIEPQTIPFSLAIISPNVLSQYVLEIGGGEAEKRNIKVGQFLRHPSIESRAQ